MSKHMELFVNVARTKIFQSIMSEPNCDAHYIINTTKISSSKVYRELRVLTKDGIIVVTQTRTGAGYKNRSYSTKYDKVSFDADKDKMNFDLRIL